ncbi:uncharacterized protein F4822DRAFT_195586 [Hypoxylon trugodes]|uniref:uncharacterized protein n=1 Tax=Hypoxylon trugodes TaxID=326681 RepID=UPI0021958227|nr:uncharacterized protein F4822DRAFT_195586 [Hypoxylon trugodes]KAI1389282.1 hypothetical protein F4822DRAFT_195586 [Hypoxylon trugodes]
MTPPCHVFPVSQLESEIQVNNGRARKGGRIDLSACELFSMVQYECQIDRPDVADSPVRCWPVQRWFRRCKDKKGSFMVETTLWEKSNEAKKDGGGDT